MEEVVEEEPPASINTMVYTRLALVRRKRGAYALLLREYTRPALRQVSGCCAEVLPFVVAAEGGWLAGLGCTRTVRHPFTHRRMSPLPAPLHDLYITFISVVVWKEGRIIMTSG